MTARITGDRSNDHVSLLGFQRHKSTYVQFQACEIGEPRHVVGNRCSHQSSNSASRSPTTAPVCDTAEHDPLLHHVLGLAWR